MDTDTLLERYESSLSSGGKLRNHYLRYAKEFLAFSKGDFGRNTIDRFLEKIRTKNNYSDGTVNFIFRVIRTLYNRNEVELRMAGVFWPYRQGEAPVIHEDKIVAPALDPNCIIEMIEMAKKKGPVDNRAFLALSTTFGLRREEIGQLEDKDVDLKGLTIHVSTLKHGRERTHVIPEQIAPWLEGYAFGKGVTEFKLITAWYQLEYAIGFDHINQVGWHSVRRTLNTLLRDKLPENTVESFMRWKQRTSSNMSFRYSAQKYVGREGTSTKVVGEFADVDSKVFAVHPFLKYWE